MKSNHSPFSDDIFFNSNTRPILITNLEFKVVAINQPALDILSYKLDEIVGKHISDFANKSTFTISFDSIEKLLSGEISHYTVIREFISKHGYPVKFDIDISLITDKKTNNKYFVGVFSKLSLTQTSDQFNFKTETLNAVIEKSPIIQYVLNIEKDVNIYENRSLSQYLGYSVNDIGDQKEFDFLDSIVDLEHFDRFKTAVNKYKQSTNSNESLEIEYKVKNKEGKDVWLYDKSVALKIKESGEKILSYGIIIDITERKNSEEKLLEQSLLLDKISKSIPEFIYIVNNNSTNILYTNRKCKDVTGYKDKEFKFLLREEFIHPTFFIEYQEKNSDFLNSKTKKSFEIVTKLKHKTKGYRWYKIRSFVFERGENSLPSKVMKILIDVNDKINEKLKSTEKDRFIKNVTTKLPSSVYVKDVKSGDILFSNVDKQDKLGYTIDEWKEKFSEFIHPEHIGIYNTKLKEFLSSDQNIISDFDILIKHKKHGYRWYNLKFRIFKKDIYNEITQILEVVEDVHEVKIKTNKIKEQQSIIENITNSIESYLYLYNTKLKKYTFSNFENRNIFGYSKDEYLKDKDQYLDIKFQIDLQKIRSELQTKNHKKKYEIEILLIHKNGETVWVNIKIIVISTDEYGIPEQILEIVEDIDESTKKVIKINEQQKLIEKISTSIPEYIYLKNTDTNQLIFSNNKANEILGYSDAEFASNWKQYIHPDQLQKNIDYQNSITTNTEETQFSIQALVRHKTKGYIWCLNKTIIFERDENLKPTKTLELISDINESKLSNDRIREQQNFIENISSTIPQYLSVYDLITKKSIYTNFDNKLIFGYTKQEYHQKSNNLIHPDYREKTIYQADKMMNFKTSNASNAIEFQILHKTKGYVWARLKLLVTERNKNGKALQALEIIENIDRSKKSYVKILDQQNFIQKVATTIPNIIQVTNVITNKIIYTNFEKRKFLDYNKEQWNATGVEIIHKDHYEQYKKDVISLIYNDTELVTNNEILVLDQNGNYKWILAINSAFKVVNNQAVEIMTIFRDINSRKELQLKLERQLSKNIELERFASITSHDLKEPLRTLGNYAQILQSEYEDKLDDMGKELLNHITSGSKRMGELINDILDFSKVQTEGNKFIEVSLNEILKLVLLDLKKILQTLKRQ